MKVFFDVAEYYYLPQYEPVIDKLAKRKVNVYLLIEECKKHFFDQIKYHCAGLTGIYYYSSQQEKNKLISEHTPEWVFFGNYTKRNKHIPEQTKFALIGHGVGPKSCYYTFSDGDFDIRFVEGSERLKKLHSMYPKKKFLDVGFVKLDPLINGDLVVPKLSTLGLDYTKKTILYAPSFFPCSIECLPLDFPEKLKAFNIILKPHFFSLSRKKFINQQERLTYWAKYENVHLVPIENTNILPYYVLSDVMFSDASSAIFEFIAMDKPIIWYQNYKLSWTYKGLLKYRLKKRMDFDLQKYFSIGAVANTAEELFETISSEIQNPLQYQKLRMAYVENLIGKVDGLVSERIVNYLLENH